MDVPGEYENDAWNFVLPTARYAGGITFKFVLGERAWMVGGNLFFTPVDGGIYEFEAPQVQFPSQDEAVEENSLVQRRFFAPNLDEGKTYDVIVIGSGIGSGVLADQLADTGLDTLVIELGSYLFPSHVGNLPRQHVFGPLVEKIIWHLWDDFKVKNYEDGIGNRFGGVQGFNLGGRSLYWGAFMPRMSWWEFEKWPTRVRWDMENFGYDLAEELLNKTTLSSSYQQQVINSIRRPLPEYLVQTAPMATQHTSPNLRTIPGGVSSTVDLLMESRLTGGGFGVDSLSINLNHAAVEIETTGSQATGVVTDDLISDRLRTFKGRAVVIAAGTIESGKLAKLSNLSDPNNLIGVGITDHPIFFTHFAVPSTSSYFDLNVAAKIMLLHQDAGTDANGNATLPPHVDSHRYNVILELGADFNQGRFIDPDILEQHRQAKGNTMICEIVFLFNSPLNDVNTLEQSGPSYEKPVVTMGESPITEAEWNEINSVQSTVLTEVGGIELPGNDLVPDRCGLGGVAHEVGTLRMGTDAGNNYADGVVDANRKFNG